MASRGWEQVTAADVAKMGRKAARMPVVKTSGRSKYHAVRTTVNGVTFDSKREAARYQVLAAWQKNGDIRKLRRQHSFTLDVVTPNGEIVQIGTYRSDFDYEEAIPFGGWAWQVEDVKGMKTDLYKWKKRHVEAQFGIQIREIR